jgi:geranylgeranyl pyrophosphate synthase
MFRASVMCALWAAEVPVDEHPPWRAFASDVGLLFQIVDDLLDGDGYVASVGEGGAPPLADDAAERARTALDALDADTEVLDEIVNGLAVRTS